MRTSPARPRGTGVGELRRAVWHISFSCYSGWFCFASAWSPVIVVRMTSGAGPTTSSVPVSGTASQGKRSVIIHHASPIHCAVGIRWVHGLPYRQQSRVEDRPQVQ